MRGNVPWGEEREGSFVAADARHELLEGGEGGGDRTSCCGGRLPWGAGGAALYS